MEVLSHKYMQLVGMQEWSFFFCRVIKKEHKTNVFFFKNGEQKIK